MPDMYDRESLLAVGGPWKFVFFWGHTPRADGTIDATCFSQWYEAPFRVDGRLYPTAEHWMMAEKARLFGDARAEAKILEAPHPGAAKRLGRAVRGFDEGMWRKRRVDIVVAGNRAKFNAHPELGAYLRGTGRRVLVEASPRDRIWGIGLAREDPRASDPALWRGENLLGFALMRVRDGLTAP